MMIYPYIGAGVLLAVICLEAGQYLLMVICILMGIGLHIAMGKKIRPVRGAVPPSAASRRAERRKQKAAQRSTEEKSDTEERRTTEENSDKKENSTTEESSNTEENSGNEVNNDTEEDRI